MGLIQKIKIKIRICKKYRKIYKPFFEEIEKELYEFATIDTSIPNEVTKVYEDLKDSGSKKYISATKQYDDFHHVVNSHNEDVRRIQEGISGFDKESILENALSFDVSVLERYYLSAKELREYKNLNRDQISVINDAILLFENFDVVKRQKSFFDEEKAILDEVKGINTYIDHEIAKPFITNIENIYIKTKNDKITFFDFLNSDEFNRIIESQNKNYIEKNKNNPIFDNVNGKSLDDEQRTSVLTDELSTLVVAGAGSGKTLTICGKVEYLLKEKNVAPEEILLLSYSKKSADDLLLKVSKIDDRLTVGTFHKIGLDVLKETQNKTFVVEDQYKAIIEEYFRVEMKNRPHMLQTILTYYSLYIASDKHDKRYKDEGEMFEDLKKQDYSTLKSQLLRLTNDVNGRETLKKEHVKSFEEMAIANWYFINGIDYVYESPYVVDVSTVDKRQYLPDFYLPKYKIYHEHYGINRAGKAEQYDGPTAQTYVDNIKWKRATHAQNHTTCIETYSFEFDEGTVFEKLERALKAKGVAFRPLSDKEVYNALESIYEGQAFKSFINLIRTFLSLYKARFRDESGFDSLLDYKFPNAYERRRATLFLRIVKDVYRYYLDYLRREDKIDFDDMILMSTQELDKSDNFKYKYIIVDEFQDISLSRMLFLKKLISHGHSKLFSVGDDWQAIYRFSGCDINIFLQFEKYFGASAITKITTTHRNSQELQDIAGPFIKANPEQYNKKINSSKHLDHPIRIMYYSDKKYYAFLDVLKEISKTTANANVLILGRNNKDFETISLDNRIYIDFKESKEHNTVVKVRDFPNMHLTYSTVHGSKGLEEDYVVIINADDSRLGFPNKMEDDELLDMVLSSKSNYEYAEERRLWYVALTRTRTYTYILANSDNPSIFVKEIEKHCQIMNPNLEAKHEGEKNCPRCKSGRLVLRVNEKTGNKFYGCSNYPYCRYTIDDFKTVYRDKRCVLCGDFMVYRKGKYGAFWGCHNYPRCDYTEQYHPKS